MLLSTAICYFSALFPKSLWWSASIEEKATYTKSPRKTETSHGPEEMKENLPA